MPHFKRLIPTYIFIVINLVLLTVSHAEEENSFLSLEEAGYGKLSGQVQHITMGRTRGGNDGFGSPLGGDAHAGSLAVTANYISPEYLGLSLGLQYVHAFELYSEGSYDGRKNAAYNLSISDFSKLNNAFIKYNFEQFGLKDTSITAGRQSLDLNFMTHYNIRQKAQAFEAIVFETEAIENLNVTLGHLSKFSSWTSKDDLNSGSTSNKFIDVENVENVNYSTKGFQFIESEFTGIPNAILSVYDYFGHDLYNTFGSKLDYSINPDSKLNYMFRFHYMTQWDVGKFAKETGTAVKADAFQTGIKMSYGNFSIEPGIFKVTGDGPEDTLHTPFQPRYIGEEPLFEIDLSFEGGSLSYFIESTFDWSKNSLYFLFLQTEHRKDLFPAGTSREFNLIYTRDITKKAYFKVKLGNVAYNNHSDVKDGWLNEYRFFLGYRF